MNVNLSYFLNYQMLFLLEILTISDKIEILGHALFTQLVDGFDRMRITSRCLEN